jgi:uncharacterized membrane protein YozB (DUF420 family)
MPGTHHVQTPRHHRRLVAVARRLGLFFLGLVRALPAPDFNELGRHYDADTQTVYTTSGFVWVVPACVCLLLAVWALVRAWRRARARGA